MRQTIWIIATAIALVAGLVLLAGRAYGQTPVAEVPIDTVLRGDPYEVIPITTIPADPGVVCTAVLIGDNNDSERPDTDILVGPAVFAGVEDGTFTTAPQTFEVAGDIVIAVRLGAQGVFSAGFLLTLECGIPPVVDPPPETTMVESTTSTTAVTTTLSPPPVGGVPTGGGACADGACDESWPWWLSVTMLGLVGGLLWLGSAFVAGGWRKETPWR